MRLSFVSKKMFLILRCAPKARHEGRTIAFAGVPNGKRSVHAVAEADSCQYAPFFPIPAKVNS
jgi:hypothetical protein